MKRTLLLTLCLMLFFACGNKLKDIDIGREASFSKDWDKAVEHYIKALGKKPANVELRIALSNALISASNHHLTKGSNLFDRGHLKPALVEFQKALDYNPENNQARNYKHQLLKQIRHIEEEQREESDIQKIKNKQQNTKEVKPSVNYKKKPYTLKFVRSDLKQIFSALQKSSGVNFIYDESFKSKRVALNLKDVDFMDALERITLQTKLFYKVISPNTILIIPDTPARRKEHEELVMRTIFLTSSEPEDIMKIVTRLTGIKSTAFDKKHSCLTLKGTPGEVKLAEKIISIYDKPVGELFLDVEIIEVNRTRVKEYGIELSNYAVTSAYVPGVAGTDAADSANTIRLDELGRTDAADFLLTLPTVNYKLMKSDQDSRIKARPQLRVVDGEKVEVKLGDKVPMPTTSFVPYNTSGPSQQPITSYKLEQIGINIDITPKIHHDGLITLEMNFELTFITNPGTDRLPPTIGNRSVKTVIKLRDNETSILAGLLRDTERRSIRGVPYLSRLPVLKEIFSGNKKEIEQTDIILTLTPRLIRFPEVKEDDMELLWVGTRSKPGLKDPPAELATEDPAAEEGTAEKPNAATSKKSKSRFSNTSRTPQGSRLTKPSAASAKDTAASPRPKKTSGETPGKIRLEKVEQRPVPAKKTVKEAVTRVGEKKVKTQKVAKKNSGRQPPVEKRADKPTPEVDPNKVKPNKIEPKKIEPKKIEPKRKEDTAGDTVKAGTLVFNFESPGALSINTETDIVLMANCDCEIRALEVEFSYDPLLLKVLSVRKGPLANKGGRSYLLKNLDKKGVVNMKISMVQPLKISCKGRLFIVRVKPLRAGEVTLKSVLLKVLGRNMQSIPAQCPKLKVNIQ
ncbi:MAG: hypothetical protein GY765_18340 [bacterium]|nr:hypothetical protein [bacterium]